MLLDMPHGDSRKRVVRPTAPTDLAGPADRPRQEPTARLFIALWPTSAARRTLADWAAGWSWPAGAAVVAPERWHLTLHFLGAVPTRRLPELIGALALPCGRLSIDFGVAEVWPRGLAVLCPLDVPTALVELHRQLAQALRRLDLPVERRALRLHVTLARRAAGAAPPAALPRFTWPVSGFALVQSEGGYHTLARFPS